MTNTNTKTSTTNNQHRLPLHRRAWFIILTVIILIALISFSIIFFIKPSNSQSANDSEVINSDAPETSEQDTINDGQHVNEDEPYSDPDQITMQYEGENPNRASELSGNITYTDYTNGVLSIGTMINQYLNSGVCNLKLTGSNGNTYLASSDIFAVTSTSACKDFIIDVTPDTYQIEITLTSDNKQGIITGEISL